MLSDSQGDPQARAEFLTKLLTLSGEKPYLLKIGRELNAPFIVLVPVTDTEQSDISAITGTSPVLVAYKSERYLPLDLQGTKQIGTVSPAIYDPGSDGWSADPISLSIR